MTSYKFVGGKLVARTAEEHADLQRRKEVSRQRMPKARSTERFIQVTLPQLDKLWLLKSQACTFIFMIMLYENFRHRGKPFILPAAKLAPQFNFRAQRRAVRQLQACGLISVRRRTRKPPEIAVL